ncbi:MAG: hypothetical protein JRJ48_04030, partial [Deltaproteobacteria bacterium]|nr:hypothetical protein [Deltaproteobacteria bacterium]
TTSNAGDGPLNILVVKASKKGKVGTCDPGYEQATSGTAKGLWSAGTSLGLKGTSLDGYQYNDEAMQTTVLGMGAEVICRVP